MLRFLRLFPQALHDEGSFFRLGEAALLNLVEHDSEQNLGFLVSDPQVGHFIFGSFVLRYI